MTKPPPVPPENNVNPQISPSPPPLPFSDKLWSLNQVSPLFPFFFPLYLFVCLFFKLELIFSSRMRTAEHLPSGWPFESSHYHSTFRTPQLAYCRHNVQPYSVHRKNNPHAAILDPWKYPDKVTFPHICGRVGKGGWQPCYHGLSSSRTFSLEGVARRERESLGESLDHLVCET